MPNELCPICHSKLNTDESWTKDPILTIRGLAGEEYKGTIKLDIKYIKELQDKRKQQEIDIGIPEGERTQFTEITPGKNFFTKKHINELRESIEKILAYGEELTEEERTELLKKYFNYDAEENYIGTYKYGQKIDDKEEWTDIDLDNKPKFPKKNPSNQNIVKIKAINIEDLRHPIPPEHKLIINTNPGWDGKIERKMIHIYKNRPKGKLKFEKSLTGSDWLSFDWDYFPRRLFYLDKSYLYYQAVVPGTRLGAYIWFADNDFKIGAYLHNTTTLGVRDCAMDINTEYMYWIKPFYQYEEDEYKTRVYRYKYYRQIERVFEILDDSWARPLWIILDKDNYYIYHYDTKKIKKISKETNQIIDEYTDENLYYYETMWDGSEVLRFRIVDIAVDKDYIYVLWKGTGGEYIDKINKETKQISTHLISGSVFAVGKNIYVGYTFTEELGDGEWNNYFTVNVYDKENLEKLYTDTQLYAPDDLRLSAISLVTTEEPIVSQKYKD